MLLYTVAETGENLPNETDPQCFGLYTTYALAEAAFEATAKLQGIDYELDDLEDIYMVMPIHINGSSVPASVLS